MASKVKRGLILAVMVVVLLVGIQLYNEVITPSGTGSNSTSTSISSQQTTTTSPNLLTGSTNLGNPLYNTFTTGTQGGNSSIAGLHEALSGNLGMANFISARSCGLIGLGNILFCDTFPDNQLDSSKWLSYGNITVTPGLVTFNNATMVTKGGFYYGKFASFKVSLNPQPNGPNGPCPPWYVPFTGKVYLPNPDIYNYTWYLYYLNHNQYPQYIQMPSGQICEYDYAVWGFARGSSANQIQWGIYWEQNGSQIRSHTRYTDFFAGKVIDQVSQWTATPVGVTQYAINWNVNSQGPYAQFIYKTTSGNIVYFSIHRQAIPGTYLYLFAASNGTAFTLYQVIILPAWVGNGNVPLVNMVIRKEIG